MTTETAPPPDTTTTEGFDWCVVEIFGHRRHAGRFREEERFGTKMLRIDIPTVTAEPGGPETGTIAGWTTHYYGGASIFSLTLSDEASVVRANKPYSPPARITYREPSPADDDDGPDEDDCPL